MTLAQHCWTLVSRATGRDKTDPGRQVAGYQAVAGVTHIARRIAVIDRFQDFTRGVVSLRDVIFFITFIGFWLFLNTVLVDQRQAD